MFRPASNTVTSPGTKMKRIRNRSHAKNVGFASAARLFDDTDGGRAAVACGEMSMAGDEYGLSVIQLFHTDARVNAAAAISR